jgi:uncharacterized sulfatase
VPLIVRIPQRLRTAAQGRPGTTYDELVSMIDLGPTVLRLAGVDVPPHMHGRPLLGADPPPPRQFVYASRDRIDERYDMVRMVRDRRYRYVRNYMPWYTWLRKIGYAERNAIRQEMRRLLAEGELRPESAQWLAPTRPPEELYDLQADPYEINNLAQDPALRPQLTRLRKECDRWMLQTRDAQLLAEPFLEDADQQLGARRAAVTGPDGETRVKKLLVAARTASADPDPAKLVGLMQDKDPAVRWWAAMGFASLLWEDLDAPHRQALRDRLQDESAAVRVAAAWALGRTSDSDEMLPVLTAGLQDENPWTRLWAIQTLDEIGDRARPARSAIGRARKDKNNYVQRIAQVLEQKFQD